jgi:hypothetical protein
MPTIDGALQGPLDTSTSRVRRGEYLINDEITFNRPQHIITLHPFTRTDVNCTPIINNIGNRPCIEMAGAGAATDGSQFQYGTAGLLIEAGKPLRIRFSYRSADMSTHEMVFGVAAVDTTLIASDPTDFILVDLATASLTPTLRSRKASGTAESAALPITLANDTWYDTELVITRDATTAGRAYVQVYHGASLASGANLPLIATIPISTQCPDTVNLAPCFGFQGTSVTTKFYVHQFAVQQQA